METLLPKRNDITTHRQMRTYSHELLRRNVIEVASYLLVKEGPDALTVRRVAHELDCSTKIIYTMFHGKDGLANALYLEGCSRLHQAISSVSEHKEPAIYLHDVSQAYWEFALALPSCYLVMFCGAIPNFTPDKASISSMATAFETLVNKLQQYMDQGLLVQGDPTSVSKILWASVHGVVSLYLLGHFPSLQEAKVAFAHTVQAVVASFLLP